MEEQRMVAAGVDTHKDVHVLCVLDEFGRKVAEGSFRADSHGYGELAGAVGDPSHCIAMGVEGTVSYGAGLTKYLTDNGFVVYEVLRPKRDKRRLGSSKNDSIDAERAARDVLASKGLSIPKSQDGWVGSLRFLWASRRTAVQISTSTMNATKGLLASSPESIRARFSKQDPREMMESLSRARSRTDIVENGVVTALKSLAKLWLEAKKQSEMLNTSINALLEEHAPALLEVFGCGPNTAAALAIAVGDNPERMRSEASFASLCGVSPIEASSGKTVRHRLNRGGNRQANWALYQIAVVRMRYDERTKGYVEKRQGEGKSAKEIIRCLKRYIAREIYQVLLNPKNTSTKNKVLAKERRDASVKQGVVAKSLGVSVATISNIERGVYRNKGLEEQYSEWLKNYQNAPTNCT